MHSAEELAELADIDVEVVEEAFEAADRLIPTGELSEEKQEEIWENLSEETKEDLRSELDDNETIEE